MTAVLPASPPAGAVRVPGDRSRLALAAFVGVAGIAHFLVPSFYERIIPKFIGHERAVVQWSGVAELLCAGLLLVPRTRRAGAWATLVLLVAVSPANIQMAVDAGAPHDPESWVAWLRLPLQLPMWSWAYRVAKRS
jgi:uncharacterized membrane protein